MVYCCRVCASIEEKGRNLGWTLLFYFKELNVLTR